MDINLGTGDPDRHGQPGQIRGVELAGMASDRKAPGNYL